MNNDNENKTPYCVGIVGKGKKATSLLKNFSSLKQCHVISIDGNKIVDHKNNEKVRVVIDPEGILLSNVSAKYQKEGVLIIQGFGAELMLQFALEQERLLKIERTHHITQTYSNMLEDFNKKLDQKILELSLLNEVAQVFATKAFDQHNIAGFLFGLLKKKIPINFLGLLLVDEEGASLMFASEKHLSLEMQNQIKIKMVNRYTQKTEKALDLSAVSMAAVTKLISSELAPNSADFLNSDLSFFTPLVVSEKTIGIMGIIFERGFSTNKEDEKFIEILATQVALFVENDRIKEAITLERNRLETLSKELAYSNQQLKEHAEKLEAANTELDAFSYTVSHDLRAPLRHISGFIDLLEKNSLNQLDDKAKHYVQTISKAAKQMGELIDDLLVFSRMSRSQLHVTNIKFESLIQEVINSLAMDFKNRKIEWKIGPLPEVMGDPTLMRVVWTNLISNAIKYTRPRDVARIEIGSLLNKEGEWAVYIKDNGVGFDMRYADKLFGVFQRLHRQEEFEGTGIGLASAQRVINRHGGKIWARSELDKGTMFTFTLPRFALKAEAA